MCNAWTVYRQWIEKTSAYPDLYRELLSLKEQPDAIQERFGRDLAFGTGGLRGVMGAGTNRMNLLTVSRASQGCAAWLLGFRKNPTAAVAYDTRRGSDEFARHAAAVLAANGISVWLFPHPMPTPALSFAIRDLACDGGIVITASHNPAQYNGYKVYQADGCQITSADAKAIQRKIEAADPFAGVEAGAFEEGIRRGRIRWIPESVTERYLKAVGTTALLPDTVPRNLSIVYTPLNGTGIFCVPRCLRENGFSEIIIPEEQRNPDGNFPTCPVPNPEVRDALEVGIRLMERTGSELLLATDPDCDRVGAVVRDGDRARMLNGNELGLLLFDFICTRRRENGTMPERPLAFKTIVTVPLADRIAERYGVELRDTLTGFKYIGEQISLLEKRGEADRFVFGFEESCGYLSGSYVRDKDGVNAALLTCEMTVYYKDQGRTLAEVLEELYREYGYQTNRQKSIRFEGPDGAEKMAALMERLRHRTPESLAGVPVVRILDYLRDDQTGLPKSNVLRFLLQDGSEAAVRPSGTEPKLKIYLTAAGETKDDSERLAERLEMECASWAAG